MPREQKGLATRATTLLMVPNNYSCLVAVQVKPRGKAIEVDATCNINDKILRWGARGVAKGGVVSLTGAIPAPIRQTCTRCVSKNVCTRSEPNQQKCSKNSDTAEDWRAGRNTLSAMQNKASKHKKNETEKAEDGRWKMSGSMKPR